MTSKSALTQIATLATLLTLVGCGPDPSEFRAEPEESVTQQVQLDRFKSEEIGNPIGDKRPWVAHVRSVDLDQDGLLDAIGCEAKDSEVVWLRQKTNGSFEEILLSDNAQAPVHVEAYDLDADGDLDILVSCMNVVFPNNNKIGTLMVLENDGQQNFTQRFLLENVERITDARAADIDNDGDLDLVVGHFGYDQGEVRWMRNDGNWNYTSEILLRLSGTINVVIDDLNGDGSLDIAAICSQQWEEIHLFENDGQGHFDGKIIWGSNNDDYAVSGLSATDLNRDGKVDLVFTNGDGFGPNPVPGPRPWHGIQWLENKGDGYFKYHRIADLGGAYSPVAVDVDHDGDMDIFALSSFNIWSNPKARSMVLYQNDGHMNFKAITLAHTPIQLLTIDVADYDKSGEYSIVSGGFHAYEPYERMSRFMIWRPQQ